MLGSNGICKNTKKNIVSMQPVVVWERDETGIERREDGRDKDREIPETELHKMFSLGLVLRITDSPPIHSLIERPHMQAH